MNEKTDQQIVNEELPFSSGEVVDISKWGSPRQRTVRTAGRGFRDGGRRAFKAIDTAYKIPDRISKSLNDFYKSLGKSFGNK